MKLPDTLDSDIDEKETREKLIDPEIAKWWLKIYVKEEVNIVKSDFKRKSYVLADGVYKSGEKYIDYLFLDEDSSPLAIIEAKRYAKDPEKGRIQARTYAKDIENETGIIIPIFLTNGKEWKFIDFDGQERKVGGLFSQEDLRRRQNLHSTRGDLVKYGVNTGIVDRKKSVTIVENLNNHFSDGHQRALVHMATGTGKTRVAMAICDSLLECNYIRNALFIADRSVLVTQAKTKGFGKHFEDTITDLRDGFTKTASLYVTTVQTLMGKKGSRMYTRFSPGFFDLIIFDEAHRSYYDKNNVLMSYFDGLMIGLTATPRSSESKSTYDLFDCSDGAPTAEYSYNDAVKDGILVPYVAKIIETKILTEGIRGRELSDDLKDKIRKQEENPEVLELEGAEFDQIFMDDKTNELIIHEFMRLCYKSDEGLPSKTIFFCASIDHAAHMKKVFDKAYPRLSRYVQVITSDIYRYEDEVRRFEHESEPRIALSVGVLDTGIDIPEICNLVFVKPVFSPVRFWQMIGRGTRNQKSCTHLEWLPNRTKENFLILDIVIGGHSNVEFHKDFEATTGNIIKISPIALIFSNRVGLLGKSLDKEQNEIISRRIIEMIDGLDYDAPHVQRKKIMIDQIKKNPFSLSTYINDLHTEIAPLVAFSCGGDPKVVAFILKVEELYSYILENNFEGIDELKEYVIEVATNILLKDSLHEVRDNKIKIISMLQEKFWEDLTFSKVDLLVKELAPLVKYYEPEKGRKLQIDAPDEIRGVRDFEFEIHDGAEIKLGSDVTDFLESNPTAKKIALGEGVTSEELLKLEEQLKGIRSDITIENIQKRSGVDYLEFLRGLLGVSFEISPAEVIRNQFRKEVFSDSYHTTQQQNVLEIAESVFIQKKSLIIGDFGQMPISKERPLEIFEYEELQDIVEKCSKIKMH